MDAARALLGSLYTASRDGWQLADHIAKVKSDAQAVIDAAQSTLASRDQQHLS